MKPILSSIQKIAAQIVNYSFTNKQQSSAFTVIPYISYASLKKVHIKGRVIKGRAPEEFQFNNSRLWYWKKVIKLFLSIKAGHTKVWITINTNPTVTLQTQTNKEGFFTIDQEITVNQEADEMKHIEYEAKLEGSPLTFTSECILSNRNTKKLIVSDIDDTILKSKATSFSAMILRTVFLPPHKRSTFPEAAAQYRLIQTGRDKTENNLFFYVSSSTWDLMPILKSFLKINDFPHGAIILQDIVTEKEVQKVAHGHKIDRITEIIQTYPEIPLTLIGDAGQKDQDIYLNLSQKYPTHIDKILIRNRWWTKKFSDNTLYIKKAQELSVELIYFDSLSDIYSDIQTTTHTNQ